MASVVLQRTMIPDRWGATPCEVVRPVQFSFMTSRWTYKPIQPGQSWETALRVALTIMLQGPDASIMGADHYHTPQVFPTWRHHMDMVAQIGNHKFYVDPISVRKTAEAGLSRSQAPVMSFLASTTSPAPNPGSGGTHYDWTASGVPSLVPGDGVRSLPAGQVHDLYASATPPAPKTPAAGGFAPIRGPDVQAVVRASVPTMGIAKPTNPNAMGLAPKRIDVANANFRPLGIGASAP